MARLAGCRARGVPVSAAADAGAGGFEVRHTPGILTLTNANTTLGYCRYDEQSGEIEYVFVNPAWRRRGLGLRLLALVEARTGGPLTFQAPISPLGAKLLASYQRAQRPA